MELILFAVAAAFVVGASVLGLHNSVSNQSSKSSVSEALDNIEKSKEELDKKIKTQLLLGTVTIIAKIANWQAGREKAQKETINAIENANGGAATAIGMNITLDAIQAIGDSISDIVAIPDVGPSIPPLIPPVIPDVGPISSPLIPPSIPNDGPIPNPLTPPYVAPPGAPPLVPPKLDPPGIPPLVPPVEKTKELGGNILWAKIIPKTGTWVPVGKTEAEWKAEHGYTTGANTLKTGENEHKKSCPLKDSNGNIIGRVDRGYRVNGNVVVDHVHLNTDVGNVHHWFNDKPKKNKNKTK